MARIFKWLAVPLAFTALLFVVLYLWWNYGPPTPVDPSLAAMGVGSIGWLMSGSLTDGIVVLVVTVLALGVLPPLNWRQVGYVAVATVAAHWIAESVWVSGRETTNGAEILRMALSYACVLIASAILARRAQRSAS
jgi:hypothetical protein